jgi:hypothetical protein
MLVSRWEILAHAAGELRQVLADARDTISDPDYVGSDWREACQGNRLLPLHVMVDFLGNVLHVSRQATSFADERLVITYLPSWFAEVLQQVPATPLPGRANARMEIINAQVSDRDLAVPLRIECEIARFTDTRITLIAPGQTPATGARSTTAVLPQLGYDLRPAQGSLVLREGQDPAAVAALDPAAGAAAIERMHWIAPSLLISAAPGARISPRELYPIVNSSFDPWAMDFSGRVQAMASSPFWGWFVLDAARAQHDLSRARSRAVVTSQQALQVKVERFQNAEVLPLPGAPRRRAGLPEADLLLASWPAGPHIEEVTRPDGVDLVFLTSLAALSLARSRSGTGPAILAALSPYLYGLSGRMPPDAPLPVTIRVDPQSPDQRFAYSVRQSADGVPFRLSVIRTEGVRVNAGLFYGPAGMRQAEAVVDFRELVADFDEVPLAILDDGEALESQPLPRRQLSNEETADLILLAIGLVPWPPTQILADLNDYATILRYLHDGKDTLGRDLSRLDFALTCAGVLLPEVLETVSKKATRLITAGDDPGQRIASAFGSVKPASLSLPVFSASPIGQGKP